VFIHKELPHCDKLAKNQIAKQFVKFNERCMDQIAG